MWKKFSFSRACVQIPIYLTKCNCLSLCVSRNLAYGEANFAPITVPEIGSLIWLKAQKYFFKTNSVICMWPSLEIFLCSSFTNAFSRVLTPTLWGAVEHKPIKSAVIWIAISRTLHKMKVLLIKSPELLTKEQFFSLWISNGMIDFR